MVGDTDHTPGTRDPSPHPDAWSYRSLTATKTTPHIVAVHPEPLPNPATAPIKGSFVWMKMWAAPTRTDPIWGGKPALLTYGGGVSNTA